jgi:hypothetical protein
MTSSSHAQTKKNGAFLLDQCRPLASLRGEPDPSTLSKLNPSDVMAMSYCAGFLDALITSLKGIHNLYVGQFPDASLIQTDTATAKRFMATTILLGPDVCVPKGLTPRISAMILEKHGREHPEDLTQDEQSFANFAFMEAYPGVLNGIRQCE